MRKIVCFIFMMLIIGGLSSGAYAADYVYSATMTGELMLHISPDDTSYRIATIPACSRMQLLKKERTWGLVSFKNKSGWINLSFTRSSYSEAAKATGSDSQKSVTVSTEENMAVLYNVPSLDEFAGSKEKLRVPNDTVLEITREIENGWGLVSMNGRYAWIRMEDTVPYQENTDTKQYGLPYVYVLSKEGKGLELWSDVQKTELYAMIPDCIKLTVREEKDGLAYVSYDGMNGWIDISQTAQSLANAQSNAGTEVNLEYEVVPADGENSVKLYTVPSDNPADGSGEIAELKKGTAVFVQRSTMDGWSLVNYDGELGWIAPMNVSVSEHSQVNITQMLEVPKDGYISTEGKKGVRIYGVSNGQNYVATIPECTPVKILAEKNGYEYLFNEFASGWAKKGDTAATYEETLNTNLLDKNISYVISARTRMMTLPTYSEKCGSTEIRTLDANTPVRVSKIVTTNKNKWGLIEYGGNPGWVCFSKAERAEVPVAMLVVIAASVIVFIAAVVLVVLIIKRKRHHKNQLVIENEQNAEKDDEHGKEISDKGSRSDETTADVQGK